MYKRQASLFKRISRKVLGFMVEIRQDAKYSNHFASSLRHQIFNGLVRMIVCVFTKIETDWRKWIITEENYFPVCDSSGQRFNVKDNDRQWQLPLLLIFSETVSHNKEKKRSHNTNSQAERKYILFEFCLFQTTNLFWWKSIS